jgi:hypothetical protein
LGGRSFHSPGHANAHCDVDPNGDSDSNSDPNVDSNSNADLEPNSNRDSDLDAHEHTGPTIVYARGDTSTKPDDGYCGSDELPMHHLAELNDAE